MKSVQGRQPAGASDKAVVMMGDRTSGRVGGLRTRIDRLQENGDAE